MNSSTDHGHEYTLSAELACHLPYAIFSVTLCFALLSFWFFSPSGVTQQKTLTEGLYVLFHIFHFMHIVFSATGTVITFLRFGRGMFKAVLLGAFIAPVVCTLSDIILPFLGGRLFGIPVVFHFCWVTEWSNVVPFLVVGLFNGLLMSRHSHSRQVFYSIFSHFSHILVSSFASLCYLISYGFVTWYTHIGLLFILMLVAVVVPCTLSDLVIPIIFAKADKRR